jgi:hypothetical protein
MARRPVDRLGFTRATVIRTRGSDGPAGRYYFSYQLENASQVVVGSTATALAQTLYPGGTRSDPDSISTQALRDPVRFISFWGRPSGVDGQTTTATYSASATFDVTFTGNCDTTVTPPPPELPEPPEQPDVPPMPPLPASCTTDTLCAMLWVVLQELHSVQQLAAVVQRYQLPFRYVLGEPIGPLTGSGSLEIAALVGIRADVTSAAPPRVLEGNPPYWWDQGWMSVLTPEGMIEEKRITRDAQVWQPRLIQEATTFGYYLKEGVSATFTPLYPEPY